MTEWSQGEIDQVRNGITETNKQLKDLNQKTDTALRNDKALADAFGKVAEAIDALTREIKALREDINPKLEKDRKLRAPGNS